MAWALFRLDRFWKWRLRGKGIVAVIFGIALFFILDSYYTLLLVLLGLIFIGVTLKKH